jgi:hypothetical protein
MKEFPQSRSSRKGRLRAINTLVSLPAFWRDGIGPEDHETDRPAVREIGWHDCRTHQEDWDLAELQSRATFSIAVLHPARELAGRTARQDQAESGISVSALFAALEQGHVSLYKALHSMGRIPPSPP